MKKIVAYLLMAVILSVACCGCSTNEDKTQNEAMTSEEFSHVLSEEEYFVYENGKAVFALSDFGESSFFFSMPVIYNDEHERIIDLEGHDAATLRGIKIGSTIREFANAYGPCEIALIDEDIVTTAEDFLRDINNYDINGDYIITITTHYISNKSILCNSEWKQYIEDNNIDLLDINDNPKKYFKKAYSIDFILEDNVINDIRITDIMEVFNRAL